MRVAVYHHNRDLRVEERPVPQIGPGELLVRVKASGICGSDVMEWYRIQKAPLILGHEVTGEVARAGEGVERFKPGDRVMVSHHVPCNRCRYCLSGHHSVCDTLRSTHLDPGGFAEYLRVPRINVETGTFLLPESVSFEEGSFIEPLGCVVRGQRLTAMRAGKTVLVVGSGISGLLHIQLARASRAERVIATDISDYRLAAARSFGADAALHARENVPECIRRLNEGRLADLVIVCTGAMAAIRQALGSVERGGTVLFFAPAAAGVEVPLPLFDFWRNEIGVMTSYAASPQDLAEAIELIKTRQIRVREMITHRLGLAETGRGFGLVADGQDSLKVIIEPERG